MNKGKVIISIIVPIYNAEKYIEYCCHSILNQAVNNIELILVNDGSTDNSFSICEKVQRSDPRVKLISIENSGPAKARNVGVLEAKGEYISFVDADDWVHKDMYKELLAYTYSLDIIMCGNFNVVGSHISQVNIPDTLTKTVITNKNVSKAVYKYYLEDDMSFGISSLWNKLYRRAFLLENALLIDESLVKAEDYWFNVACFKLCNSLKVINKPLYYYRRDTAGSVMKSYREGWLEQCIHSYNKLYADPLVTSLDFDHNKYMVNFANNAIENIMLGLSHHVKKDKLYELLSNDMILKSLRIYKTCKGKPIRYRLVAYCILYSPNFMLITMIKMIKKL
jgi:glycosyltransferase involved in cell wall biosynthesis